MDLSRVEHIPARHSRTPSAGDPQRLSLESVLITDELSRRSSRAPQYEAENRALISLARQLANSPETVLQKLVELVMELCHAHSAGVSLLETLNREEVFRWHAIAGQVRLTAGGTIPRSLSPCGIVVDRQVPLLFRHLARHFAFPMPIDPPVVEALLVPFKLHDKPIGTLWAISHNEQRKFDAEDQRILQSLGEFAASAYQMHTSLAARRESDNRQRSVIHNLSEGLVIVDLRTGALQWNRSALKMLGYDELGFEHMHFSTASRLFEVFRLDGAPVPFEQRPGPRLLRNEEFSDYEALVRRKSDGRERIFSYSGVIVKDSSGQPEVGLLNLRDITDLKRAQQLVIQNEKLASVGRMAATIAHEINNPLASAMNTLFLASGIPGVPEHARSYINLADSELRRIAHITRQTLGFYRETGNPKSLCIPDMLDGTLDLFTPKLRNKSIRVQRRYCGPGKAFGIEGELHQIFSNLISNSIDATSRGTLHVRTRSWNNGARPMLRVTIADTGHGIPRENLGRIFEPFFTTKKAFGTGLGLWITSELVRKHEGHIRVRSRIGKGTVFSIWIPGDRRQDQRTPPAT